jgi:hypothetical protein
VPDLRLLPPRAAERRLTALSLHPRMAGQGPRVLAQQPAAGTAIERGSRVDVWLSAPPDSSGGGLPNLVGLAVRQALRELTVRQVPVRITGHGFVVRQFPEPGTPLPLDAPCLLTCEPRPSASAGEVPLPGLLAQRFTGREAANSGDPKTRFAGVSP